MDISDQTAISNAYGVMATAGVYPTEGPGTKNVGLSKTGKPIFSTQSASSNTDISSGKNIVGTIAATLAPLGALSDSDVKGLIDLSKRATNAEAIKSFDNLEPKDFIPKVHNHILPGSGNKSSLFSVINLAHTWDKLSPGQKSIGLAGAGLQGHKFSDGSDIYTKQVIADSENVPGLKSGEALNALTGGVNIYPLVKNWNQITTLTKISGGPHASNSNISFANSTGLLGHGLDGGEVPNTSIDKLQAQGFKAAPQFGPGAILGPAKSMPRGYSQIKQIGEQGIGIPTGTSPMGIPAVENSLVGTAGGNSGISSGAAELYKSWEKRDTKTTVGANGGSQLAAGLIKLSQTNPFAFSANIGASLLRNTKEVPKEASDYISKLAGVTLGRLIKGESSLEADKEGIKLAKGVTSLPELKLLFTQKGITGKADAYQLANQGYGEGRFNESDLVAMHQVFNNVFDSPSSFTLKKLLDGRERAAQVIKNIPADQKPKAQPKKVFSFNSPEEAAQANKNRL